jgi:hypothetical protein
MVRPSPVPDSPQSLQPAPPPRGKSTSPVVTFLREYAVALVNGAALLYILVRIVLAAVHRMWDVH